MLWLGLGLLTRQNTPLYIEMYHAAGQRPRHHTVFNDLSKEMNMLRKIFTIMVMAAIALSAYAASAVIDARPTQIDISSASSESAVLVTVSDYTSDDARYRLYNGSNQYNCWDAATSTYITSTNYSSGPQVPGTPTTSSTWWIMFQRGNNATTVASYRDRLGPAYTSNYRTTALPAATAITTPVSITNSDVTFSTWNDFSSKYVILAYDATVGGTLISATSSALTTGAFNLVVEAGTTIQRIEVRDVLNNLIESVTGTWPAVGQPIIAVTGSLNPFTAYTGSPSASQSYTLSGSNLTAGIVVTPPAGFAISTDDITFHTTAQTLASTFNGPVYVRLTGATAGNYSGDITHTSSGATQVDLAVSGTVSDPVPTIHTIGTLNAFATLEGTPSAAQTYTLYGEFLTANIIVTPPTGFELSTDGNSYSSSLSLASTFNGPVYVRLIGTTVGNYSGNITHTSTGATQVDLPVTGEVQTPAGPTIFLEENFNYTAGELLTANGWTAHSGIGSNPAIVGSTGLTYAGYPPSSGLSGETVFSGPAEDVHRTFPVQTNGAVYASFLFNAISLPNTTADYLIHFGPDPIGTDLKGRFFIQKDSDGNLRFGLTKAAAATGAVWTDYVYVQNTTYLIVIKYVINSGTANDEVYMWVNPAIGATEPTPQLTASDATGTDAANIGSIAIRQGTNTPLALIDGIRVSNVWAILWSGDAPPTPVITVTGEPAPLANYAGCPSEEMSEYSLSGSNLQAPIQIVAPEGFEVSSTGTDGWASSINVPADFNGLIYVRLVSGVVGTHGGNITHNSSGATEVTVRVEGETFVSPVVWNITANLTAFDHEVGTPSAAQSYTLSATGALDDITVSVAIPFELSLNGSTGWTDELVLTSNFNGSVYVRMNSATAGQFTDNVVHSSLNATPYNLPVSGTAALPAGNYATDLFFSEYIEGDSNNKALEIFNGTGVPVDLSAYKVFLYPNGATTPNNTLTFPAGTMLAHNDVYVIANSGANAAIQAEADTTSTVTYFNGDDAVALVKIVDGVDQNVDIIGCIGEDPGAAWTADGGYSTLNKTLVRKPTVTEGISVNPTTGFPTLATEWDVYPQDTTDYLGFHTFTPGVQVAEAPVLTPAGGVYYSTVNVTMSSATPGATIYYTTDGSTPSDTNGLTYTAPIAVSATTTVKAIAYATGYTPSSVTTEAYMLPVSIPDIATLRAQPTGSNVYKLTGEAVLTFQQAQRHQKYIQDATAAILIDDNAGLITSTYNLYDGITGVTGTLGLYRNMLQFTPVADPGAATSSGNTIVPEVRTLASLTTADQAKLIKVMNATVDATLGTYPANASNINVTDPTATLVMRTFPNTDYSGTPIHTVPVNITCLVGQYDANMQISPRFLADFEVAGGTLDAPVVTISRVGSDIQLTWADVDGATSYRVEAASDPYGTYTTLGTTTDISYTIQNPTEAMKFFRVIAIN